MMQRNFFLQSLEITMHLKLTYLEYTPQYVQTIYDFICYNSLYMLRELAIILRIVKAPPCSFIRSTSGSNYMLGTTSWWQTIYQTPQKPTVSSQSSRTLFWQDRVRFFFFFYLGFLLRTFTNHRNFDLLHRHLDIRRTITVESSYLHVGSD